VSDTFEFATRDAWRRLAKRAKGFAVEICRDVQRRSTLQLSYQLLQFSTGRMK